MTKITIGEWLKNCREESNISIGELAEGICTHQFLNELEQGQKNCDLSFFVLLLQRIGRCPDKLEYILTWQEYRSECLWGCFMSAVFQQKREWAERLFAQYVQILEQKKNGQKNLDRVRKKESKKPVFEKTRKELWKCPKNLDSVGRMYLFRGRALIAYWMDRDLEEAEKYLKCALDSTFPRWKQKDWTGCRISLIELENALALVRVWREQKGEKWNIGKTLLECCGTYIQKNVKDREEHTKIYSKYAWIAADAKMDRGELEEAIFMCLEAFTQLRQFGIEYFAIPILKNILICYKRLENRTKGQISASSLCFAQFRRKKHNRLSHIWITKERCDTYYKILKRMREKYLEKWYPENSILWNCCQRMYHLDVEILFAERQAFGMTQEELAEGIYKWGGEIARIENGKVSPSWKRFELMMEKFGMSGEHSCYINTSSLQAVELGRDIQIYASRHQYDAVKALLRYLEEQLDMEVMENWRIVRFYYNVVAMYEENSSFKEILKEDLELLQQTWHIPLEAIGEQAKLKPKRRKWKRKNGKNKEKKYLYRAPMKIEALLLDQIAALLKKMGREEEAKSLYEGVIHIIEKSRIRTEFQFYSYGPLLGNMAAQKYSIKDAEKVIRTSLRCGKMGEIGNNYLTIACAMLDDNSNRECCMQMMRDSYYLFELSDHRQNMRILKDYFMEKFGVEIAD